MDVVQSLSFNEHPASVGETYLQHMGTAFGFSGRMLLGAMACFVHGLLPFMFTRTGSGTIMLLHERMITARHRPSAPHSPSPAR
jgi:hypothetical protein